ncbi:MAG: exodeoxyribonuclease V subunit alpha [Methylococcales bacterium]|nr:exodeoxyribonuclease V subunit alpha [Methylococcales bacterium]
MATNDERQYSRLACGFARFLGERSILAGESKTRFEALILELSAQQSAGHSCLALANDDRALVLASGLASTDRLTPLIVEQNRLYLHRYWQYEQRLARQVSMLCRQHFAIERIDAALDRYFPAEDADDDRQKLAAKSALSQGLTLISGGPGTGKTTTVVRILALLLETAGQGLHMALAAPTGKAAMRLQEAIAKNKVNLPCRQDIRERIPEKVATIHRLLGPKPPSPYFRHCAGNPLPYDVLVIDESSMVDLALMSKLLEAVKPGARLILLGDKDQLASVESGAVLADLTQSLPGQTVELQKSYRFQGGIKALAEHVNRQQADLAWQLLENSADGVSLLKTDPVAYIAEQYLEYLQLMADGADFPGIFAAFDRFRVLCANQRGHHSVSDINARVEQALSDRGKINLTAQWYAGRPVMVSANDPALQLYNGDIGVCLADPESDSQLRVFFLRGDGSVKKLLPARLSNCETVFAMTVHKSQGSEYDKVLVMLPTKMNPVLGKELLYTAVTRAKTQVGIVADRAVFMASVGRKVQRHSGLAEKLLQMSGESSGQMLEGDCVLKS